MKLAANKKEVLTENGLFLSSHGEKSSKVSKNNAVCIERAVASSSLRRLLRLLLFGSESNWLQTAESHVCTCDGSCLCLRFCTGPHCWLIPYHWHTRHLLILLPHSWIPRVGKKTEDHDSWSAILRR